jgi:hypothetical protein
MVTIRNQAGEIKALVELAEYLKLSPSQIISIIKGE